jgi:hypothetical protein
MDHLSKDPTYYDHDDDEGEEAPDGSPAHEQAETPAEEAEEHASGAEPPDEPAVDATPDRMPMAPGSPGGHAEPDEDNDGWPSDNDADNEPGPEDAMVPQIVAIFQAWAAARTNGGQLPQGTPEYAKPEAGETAGQFADRLADALANDPEYQAAVTSVGVGDWRDWVTAVGRYEAFKGQAGTEAPQAPDAAPAQPPAAPAAPGVMKGLDDLIAEGRAARIRK